MPSSLPSLFFLLKKTKPAGNIAKRSPLMELFFLPYHHHNPTLLQKPLFSVPISSNLSFSISLYMKAHVFWVHWNLRAILDGFTGKRNSQLLPCQCSSSSSSDDNQKPTNQSLHYEGRRALIGSLLTSGLCQLLTLFSLSFHSSKDYFFFFFLLYNQFHLTKGKRILNLLLTLKMNWVWDNVENWGIQLGFLCFCSHNCLCSFHNFICCLIFSIVPWMCNLCVAPDYWLNFVLLLQMSQLLACMCVMWLRLSAQVGELWVVLSCRLYFGD